MGKVGMTSTWVYFIGVFLFWSYIVAYNINYGEPSSFATSVIFGWFIGFFWPLAADVATISYIFF